MIPRHLLLPVGKAKPYAIQGTMELDVLLDIYVVFSTEEGQTGGFRPLPQTSVNLCTIIVHAVLTSHDAVDAGMTNKNRCM